MLKIHYALRGSAIRSEIADRLLALRGLRQRQQQEGYSQATTQAIHYHQHCLALVRAARRRSCFECGAITTGSIGQAGIFWPCLCQSCKDRADGVLRSTIRAQAHAHRAIESALSGVSSSS